MNDLLLMQASKLKVFDGFNRTDNDLSLGNADTGQVWEALSGVWGISSNKAYLATVGDTRGISVINTGLPNCEVSITVPVISANMRLVCRASNKLNFLQLVNNAGIGYILAKVINGNSTTIGSCSAIPTNGDALKIVMQDSLLSAYINNVFQFSVTETFNQTATKHGMGLNMVLEDARYDNFCVEV